MAPAYKQRFRAVQKGICISKKFPLIDGWANGSQFTDMVLVDPHTHTGLEEEPSERQWGGATKSPAHCPEITV